MAECLEQCSWIFSAWAFPAAQWGNSTASSVAWDSGRAVPALTSLVMEGDLQDCLLLEAIVWLLCTHLYLLRDYSPDFPSPWSCGCWSFHSPLSVAPYPCQFLPHLSSSPLSSPFTSSLPISYPACCFTSLHLPKSSTVSRPCAIPLDPISTHSTQHEPALAYSLKQIQYGFASPLSLNLCLPQLPCPSLCHTYMVWSLSL